MFSDIYNRMVKLKYDSNTVRNVVNAIHRIVDVEDETVRLAIMEFLKKWFEQNDVVKAIMAVVDVPVQNVITYWFADRDIDDTLNLYSAIQTLIVKEDKIFESMILEFLHTWVTSKNVGDMYDVIHHIEKQSKQSVTSAQSMSSSSSATSTSAGQSKSSSSVPNQKTDTQSSSTRTDPEQKEEESIKTLRTRFDKMKEIPTMSQKDNSKDREGKLLGSCGLVHDDNIPREYKCAKGGYNDNNFTQYVCKQPQTGNNNCNSTIVGLPLSDLNTFIRYDKQLQGRDFEKSIGPIPIKPSYDQNKCGLKQDGKIPKKLSCVYGGVRNNLTEVLCDQPVDNKNGCDFIKNSPPDRIPLNILNQQIALTEQYKKVTRI